MVDRGDYINLNSSPAVIIRRESLFEVRKSTVGIVGALDARVCIPARPQASVSLEAIA